MIEPDGRRVIAWFHVKIEEFCYIHGWEPGLSGDYRACLECAHIFRTERELIDATNELQDAWSLPLVTSGDNIWICPHCAHDF